MKTYLDIGDIVGAEGGIRRTDKGELSVVAKSLQVTAWETLNKTAQIEQLQTCKM